MEVSEVLELSKQLSGSLTEGTFEGPKLRAPEQAKCSISTIFNITGIEINKKERA